MEPKRILVVDDPSIVAAVGAFVLNERCIKHCQIVKED